MALFSVTVSDTGLAVSDATQEVIARLLSDDAFSGIASNTPVLDDCTRADEVPLSDSGAWTRAGSLVGNLGLFSDQIYGGSGIGQMSFIRSGDLTDSEAWGLIGGVPGFGNFVGVIVRQDPSSNTGANCYGLIYNGGLPGTLQLIRTDGSGAVTVLASVSAGLVTGDRIGVRAVGSTISGWYKPSAGSWSKVLQVTDSTLAHGYLGARFGTNVFTGTLRSFGGGSFSDSLARVSPRTITDTGLTITDSIFRFFPIRDTGLTLTDTLRKHVTPKPITDTGLALTDSLGRIELTDTGLTLSDSLAKTTSKVVTDTVTVTDATQKIVRKFLADTGLSFNSALVVRKNGGNVSVNIADAGLALTESLSKNVHLFRSIPSPSGLPDVGIAISDGIFVRGGTTPTPPTATFTYAISGLTTTFTDTSTPGSAPITSWAWDFGDGTTSTLQNPPPHTYAAPGAYVVTLTVVTTAGGTTPRTSTASKVVSTSPTPVGAGFHIDAVIF